ncbi:ribonuclease P protein component [Planotetraspora sp. GP83]|uniref:ribonuclease P protein component n=1 Tax=Planotetraspora sp. GP83 TaxID=3156264 RepID=UPI003513D6BC
MLPSASRMRRGDEFADAIRRGRRAGRPTLVAHFSVREADEPPLVGFVVSKAVGGAVIRNQVKRRLRHLMRTRVDRLPRGSLLVVRANPPAASARSEHLAAELDVALDRLLRRRGSESRTPTDGRS